LRSSRELSTAPVQRCADNDKLKKAAKFEDNKQINKKKKDFRKSRAAEARAVRGRKKRAKEQGKANKLAQKRAEREHHRTFAAHTRYQRMKAFASL
jgi:hypothetical protein